MFICRVVGFGGGIAEPPTVEGVVDAGDENDLAFSETEIIADIIITTVTINVTTTMTMRYFISGPDATSYRYLIPDTISITVFPTYTCTIII